MKYDEKETEGWDRCYNNHIIIICFSIFL